MGKPVDQAGPIRKRQEIMETGIRKQALNDWLHTPTNERDPFQPQSLQSVYSPSSKGALPWQRLALPVQPGPSKPGPTESCLPASWTRPTQVCWGTITPPSSLPLFPTALPWILALTTPRRAVLVLRSPDTREVKPAPFPAVLERKNAPTHSLSGEPVGFAANTASSGPRGVETAPRAVGSPPYGLRAP